MSAEILRRAASLMRERAKGATWVDFAGKADWAGDVAALGLDEETDAHVAGMSPSVALAVADWLDGVAHYLEARADDEWFDLDGDPIAPEDTHAIGSALAVARAYLGESA